jgi:hypothetical protein
VLTDIITVTDDTCGRRLIILTMPYDLSIKVQGISQGTSAMAAASWMRGNRQRRTFIEIAGAERERVHATPRAIRDQGLPVDYLAICGVAETVRNCRLVLRIQRQRQQVAARNNTVAVTEVEDLL